MSASLQSLMPEMPAAAARPSLARGLVSFLLVGGLAALAFIGLSMLMIGLGTGIPDWIVSAGCYAALIGPVYLAHRRFSFRSDTPHRVALPRYVAVQLCALVLASLFSFILYDLLRVEAMFAAPIVVGLTSGVNFVVLKLWAFAHRT